MSMFSKQASDAFAEAVEKSVGAGREVSEWIDDEHCAFRHLAGTDPEEIATRVAFIEKTPRVRCNESHWEQGPKGCAPEYGRYPPSREWCDRMLRQMGHRLPE